MKKKKCTVIVLILFFISFSASACGVQESHVKGNVPDKKEFYKILTNDLELYFKNKNGDNEINIKYELLRNGPTQSGTSYPKFYIWVSITNKDKNIEEGAIRCAAIDGSKFQITHYLTKYEIKDNTEEIEKIFPKEVCKKIIEKVNK